MSIPEALSNDSRRQPQMAGIFPPRPPLVFHVGVTGHRLNSAKRPDPDIDALRGVIREILALIKNKVHSIAACKEANSLFHQDTSGAITPTVRIISSLAEGSDTWVAEEAITLSYELQAPLPFPLKEYRKDFAGEAERRLDAFFQVKQPRSPVLFELDGSREKSSLSYLQAGRQVIQQSDVLIAVWDGKREHGRGGAGQIVREAMQAGVPVVWIKWAPPAYPAARWQLITGPIAEGADAPPPGCEDPGALERIIAEIVLPPDFAPSVTKTGNVPNRQELPGKGEKPIGSEQGSLRLEYFNEHPREWTWIGGFWGFFMGLIGLKDRWEMPHWKFKLGDYASITDQEWSEKSKSVPALAAIDPLYRDYYAWANQLSLFYGSLHRSSSLFNYLLGALAVGIALTGGWMLNNHQGELPWLVFESIIIIAIIIFTLLNRHGRWHQRWIEYRTLAERFRISRLTSLMGGWRQQTSMPGHLAGYGNPINTWVFWYYRAVERSVGLPNGNLDKDRLENIKYAFAEILTKDQIGYHGSASQRLKAADRRLHKVATWLFIATLAGCAVQLCLLLSEKCCPAFHPVWPKQILSSLNAFLPALAAAFASIRHQGEFQGLAQRFGAMCAALGGEKKEKSGGLYAEVNKIKIEENALKSMELRKVIGRIGTLMLNESLDWSIIFQDRGPDFPA